MSSSKLKLHSKIEIEPSGNNVNLERLGSHDTRYEDIMDAFARELSSDEVLLISGAGKAGGLYCGRLYA